MFLEFLPVQKSSAIQSSCRTFISLSDGCLEEKSRWRKEFFFYEITLELFMEATYTRSDGLNNMADQLDYINELMFYLTDAILYTYDDVDIYT